jgi:hypothetical protein
MAKSFESRVVTVRRRAALLAPTLAGAFLSLAGSLGHLRWLTMCASLVQIAGAASLILFLRNAWPSRKACRLRADARGISLDGSLAVPRGSILSGHAQPGPEPVVRILRRRSRFPLDLRMDGPDDVRGVLEALGLDVGSATARFGAIYGGMRRQMFAAGLFGLLLSVAIATVFATVLVTHHAASSLLLVLVPPLLALGALLRSQTRVTVGVDGLLVSRLGAKQFVPYADVEALTPEKNDLVISIRGRRPLRLGFGLRSVIGEEFSRDALIQRVSEARAARAPSDQVGEATVAALLARGERAPREWLDGIRALARDPSYRKAELSAEHLWRIVEDPGTEATSRAGAAAALVPSLDEAGRGRLRVAAEACASPRLRVALQAAAATVHEEEEPLEEAFASLAPEEPARRTST